MKYVEHLYFRISGEDLCFSDINTVLDFAKPITHKKGEIIEKKYQSKNGDNIIKEDSWLTDYKIPKNQSFEDAVVEFLKPYLPHKNFISEMSKKHAITLWVSAYPEVYQLNINLSKKIISILHELNIEMDITYLYLVDIYEGRDNPTGEGQRGTGDSMS